MKTLAIISLAFLSFIACDKPNAQTNTPTTEISNKDINTYQWDKHQNFEIFFTDFKTAVKNNDKAAIYKMMNLPFKCNDIRCTHANEEGMEEFTDFSIANEADFNTKFDLIFSAKAKESILNNKALSRKDFPAEDEHMPLDEMYRPNEFCLDIETKTDHYYVLSFMPDSKGMYKLNEMPYRP